ncbi:MAG: TolC family protein [Deltaproteobacteria bacterium]|jgi:outer membrane protein|nr:TolC family protein [Deltaproteobacteria bacterium]
MKRLFPIILTGILNFSVCPAFSAPIEIAFDNLKPLLDSRSSRLKAAEIEREASRERTGSLGRSFLPKIELHAAQESFKSSVESWQAEPSFGAEINLNLFNGGRDGLENQIRELHVERKVVQVQQVVADELQTLRKLYWETVYTLDKIDQIEAAIKVNVANMAAAVKRIRSGVATESDRVEFEMNAVDLDRELAESRLKLANQSREFAILLNFSLSEKLTFPRRLEHNHDFEAALKHEAQDHDFLYKDDELKSQEGELAAEKQRRSWWPEVDAFAAYNDYSHRIESAGPDTSNDATNEAVIGIRMKMGLGAIFDGTREAAALAKEASADKKRADLKRRQAEAHMENELAELRLLHEQIHSAEENILRAERYYKLTQSEYGRGVKNSPDVLGASEKLYENRLKRLEIIKDFQIAKSHVLAKIGK